MEHDSEEKLTVDSISEPEHQADPHASEQGLLAKASRQASSQIALNQPPIALTPRSEPLVIGMVSIVGVISISVIFGGTPFSTIVAASAICFLVATFLVIQNRVRWSEIQSVFQNERKAFRGMQNAYRKIEDRATRSQTALSHLVDGVVLLKSNAEIVLLNDAAKQLLAMPASGDYLKKKFSDLVRVPEINEGIRRAFDEKVDQNVSVELLDGASVRPIAVRIDHIRGSTPPYLLLVVADQTEAHRVESVRREFIANVSHELKTPLAAIKGYAETIELAIDDDPDAARHFVGQMDDQCLRLEALIADMMRLARAQSGKGTLVVQSIDLYQVIEKAMVPFGPLSVAKKIDLRLVGREESARVMADEEAALTIIQNLISNALRHTDEGGHVIVSCRQDGTGWTLSVQDDGAGIKEEFQDRIFERFYRVDRSRKSYDEGTGIGLSIVKNLVRALDGTVRVVSREGQGATFEVWFPGPG